MSAGTGSGSKLEKSYGNLPQGQEDQVVQEVEEQEEQLEEEEAPPNVPPKTDMSLSTSSELQSGQRTSRFSEREKKRTSKTFPHCLQRNS